MIPPSFIQDLLARTDVADVVGKYVTLKKAGINFKGLCPFHGEKSPSFIVSPSRQTYHCFGCGVHGNAIGFIMEFGGMGFIDAVKDLAQMQGMPVPDDKVQPEERERQKQVKARQLALTDVMAQAAKHWRVQLKQSPRAVNYLKGRGLTGEIAAQFGLGYAPDSWRGLASAFTDYNEPLLVESGLVITHEPAPGETEGKRYDRFRDRIMFPIRNPQGEVIGFGGRVLDKGEPKYLNSPETPVFIKGRELYGLYEGRAALRNKGYAIVTEGYMDVVALAQWGFGNAVATLGTACSQEHVQKLFRFTEHIVFSFDGDAAGRRAAGRALEAALPFATDTRRLSFLFLPAEHDPDSFIREHGAEAFEACVKKAVPLSRQLIQHAAHDCDLDSAEGRAKLLAQAIPMLAQMPDGALRQQVAQDLATQARSPAEDVLRRLNQQGQAGQRSGHWQGQGGDAPRPPEPSSDMPFDDGNWHAEAEQSHDGWKSRQNGNGWRERSGRDRWRRNGNGWERQARQPRGPLIQAARPLERAAWLLLRRSDLWEQLPHDIHDLLCEQAMPLGGFFSWLDRVVASEGPISQQALVASWLPGNAGSAGDDVADGSAAAASEGSAGTPPWSGTDMAIDPGVSSLVQRLCNFHAMDEATDSLDDLISLLRPLQLQALRDELDLLLESGELSDAAEARKRDLIRQTNALKLEITRLRPISV